MKGCGDREGMGQGAPDKVRPAPECLQRKTRTERGSCSRKGPGLTMWGLRGQRPHLSVCAHFRMSQFEQ